MLLVMATGTGKRTPPFKSSGVCAAGLHAEQLVAQIQTEKNERITMTRELGTLIERQAIGGADPQRVAVLFFVAGIVYATAPSDLIRLVSAVLHAF